MGAQARDGAGNPVTDSDKPEPLPQLPGVLTPEETKSFFAALGEHSPGILPFWAVRAFAGIREAEALRMDWKMIDLTAGKIVLPATITKTRKSREIEIQPVLAAFLMPYAKQAGPLCALSPMARRWHLRLALRAVPGLIPPRNWARHSFATYHLLAFRHAGETSLQLGHKGGPELLHSTYAGVGTEAQALAYWAIRPEKVPVNVVPFSPPVEWPAPEELQALLWEKPVVAIAAALKISDTAVLARARKHGLTKPPRGHWSKRSPEEAAQ